jgi:hypothetical protein
VKLIKIFKVPFSKGNFFVKENKKSFEIFKDIQIWTFCMLPVFGLRDLSLPLDQWFSKLAQIHLKRTRYIHCWCLYTS